MSEVSPNWVRLGDLAMELGLTNAELVSKSFRLGIKVITGDVANHKFSVDEADLLRLSPGSPDSNEPVGHRGKKKKSKKTNKSRTQDTDDLTTPTMFAEYYKKSVDEVLMICNSHGFNILYPEQRLTIKQINLLYKNFALGEKSLGINLVSPLKSSIGDLLSDAENSANSLKKGKPVHDLAKELGVTNDEVIELCHKLGIGVKGSSSTVIDQQADRLRAWAERDGITRGTHSTAAFEKPILKSLAAPKNDQKNKRISVLADELNVQELTLRWLIDAVRATVIEGKQPKINVRDEAIVKAASDVWAKLPVDTNMIDRMRVSKIAKRSGATIKELFKVCSDFNIKIQNKSFVSASDGVYLQALYSRKKLETQPKRNVEIVPQKVNVPSAERVQYRNTSYLRQNFVATSFENSDFLQVNFGYADISGSDFTGCSLKESQLTRVRAVGSVFVNAEISNCSFDFADLTGASFLNSELSAVSFRKAIFAETKWIDGRLINSESEI